MYYYPYKRRIESETKHIFEEYVLFCFVLFLRNREIWENINIGILLIWKIELTAKLTFYFSHYNKKNVNTGLDLA